MSLALDRRVYSLESYESLVFEVSEPQGTFVRYVLLASTARSSFNRKVDLTCQGTNHRVCHLVDGPASEVGDSG